MKKINLLLALAILTTIANAQYKKASFLNKDGRTYDLGISPHFLSNSSATAMGILFSYGRDKGNNRIFHWYDLELILPTTFKYTTNGTTYDNNTNAYVTIPNVHVTGKSTTQLIWRYNFAYYLLNNQDEKNKLLPFVSAGINWCLSGASPSGVLTVDNNASVYDLDKYPAPVSLSVGADVAAGAIYDITKVIGAKILLGYNFQKNYHSSLSGSSLQSEYYYFLDNHLYGSIGIRFRMDNK